jgi:hypothetical protein
MTKFKIEMFDTKYGMKYIDTVECDNYKLEANSIIFRRADYKTVKIVPNSCIVTRLAESIEYKTQEEVLKAYKEVSLCQLNSF